MVLIPARAGSGTGGVGEEALPADESVGGGRGLGHNGSRGWRGRRHRHRRPQGRTGISVWGIYFFQRKSNMSVTCQRIGDLEIDSIWMVLSSSSYKYCTVTVVHRNKQRDIHLKPAGAPSRRRRRSCWWCTTATAAFTGAAPTATASSSTRGRPASPPPTASANAGAPARSPRSLCSSDYGE